MFHKVRSRLRHAGVVLALVGGAIAIPAAATAATAPATPDIDWVEIQADNTTVKMRWQPMTGVDGYEFYWRLNATDTWKKFAWAHQVDLGNSSVLTLSPAYTWAPKAGSSYELTMVSKRYSDQMISTYATPAQVTMLGAIAGVQASATTTSAGVVSLTTKWTAYTGPFTSYNFFISTDQANLNNCYVGWAGASTTRTTSTGCAGAALLPSTTYWSAVRAIQKQDTTGAIPNVWTALASTQVTTPPRAELLKTAAVSGTWRIVDSAGTAVQLKGVSVRRSNTATATQAFASAAELSAIKAKGFDTIRVPMEWSLFEPAQGQWSTDSFAQLTQLVNDASALGLKIILDPIHHVSGLNIPQWAWTAAGVTSTDPGVRLHSSLKVVSTYGHNYLAQVATRYSANPQVVAIELANELGEPSDAQTFDARMTDLMTAYHDMIRTIRAVDVDKVLILQPYGGDTRVTATQLARVRNATVKDPAPLAANFTNLVWSYHDYTTGLNGDGYTTYGYPNTTAAANGMLAVTYSWNASSCYPSGTISGCPDNSTYRTGTLIPGMKAHLAVQTTAANGASMPVLIGEYGVPHPANPVDSNALGWTGGDRLITDKVSVFMAQGVSRIYWAFSANRDEGYGLFYPSTNTWHAWTSNALG